MTAALSQIAVSNIAWAPEDDEAVATFLRKRGVTAIEVAPGRLFAEPATTSTADIETVRAFWDKHGIRIAAMQGLLFRRSDLTLFADVGARDAMAAYLRRIIALAAQLGCGPLVFGSPGNRLRGNTPLDFAFDRAAEFFRPLAEFAHERGCVLCFEPNAAAYGCDFVRKIGEATTLARLVEHPAFLVQLDVGNFMMEGDSLDDVRAAAPLIGHCHASAPTLSPVGENSTPLGSLITAARSGGYRGLVSIEMRKVEGDPVPSIARALVYVTETISQADD
jgi:sugar phosphate isomerase/epimerase